MSKNKHVMKKAFREGLTAVYREALESAGIGAEEIRVHLDSAGTVTITDAELDSLREARPDMIELSGHSNAGRIRIHLPEAGEYLANNRPTLTDEERAARKGKGGSQVDEAERQRRKEAAEALKRKLDELHGIDLDGDS